MATKSDFAQKLLNDLKLRKERLAASQTSSRDAYRNTGQTYSYRGTRQNKPLESVGSKPMHQRTRSSGSSKSLDIKETSQQIVSYGRNGSSSDYVGDLSMAFAYALQNGKLDFSSKNSSMIDFLHQIGRRSLDMGKMDHRTGSFANHRSSSTSHFPTVSHIHIKEISKGVQNLNQILRACSNGVNFDKYSIEVGKELLKGAKGLEESLRMLVNLQEASECMVNPQRKNKNRITLLDEDEEEDNGVKIAEQRQVDLPRFSFDKRLRKSRGTKDAANQSLLALTYSSDPPSLTPHQRSASYGTDFRTLSTMSDTKSSASSVQTKSEKARISNVIAKLMGLEEVPEKVESQSTRKPSVPKKKEGSDTNTKSTAEVEKTKAVKQAFKMQKTQDTAVLLRAEKTEVSLRANGGVPDGKPHRVNVTPAVLGSNKTIIAVDKRQSHNDRSSHIPENGQDDEKGYMKHKEEKSTEEGLNMEVKHNNKSALATGTLEEKIDGEKIKLQREKTNEARVTPSNHQRSQKHQGLLQQRMPSKSEQQNRKPVSKQELPARNQDRRQVKPKVSSKPATGIQKKQSITNQVMPSKPSKKSTAAVIDEIPLKELPDDKENEDLSRDESSIKSSRDGSSNKDDSLKELESKQEAKPASEQPIKQEKPVHAPLTTKKEDSMYKREVPRMIDKVVSRRNGTLDKLARSSKHQHPLIRELKQRSQERLSSLEGAEKITSEMPEGLDVEIKSKSNIQPVHEAKGIQEEDERATTTRSTDGDECQSPKILHSSTSKDNIQKMTYEVISDSSDQTGQIPDCTGDVEIMIQDSSENPRSGANGGKKENFHVSKPKHKKVQVVLTENEKHLKEILIKGHSFLSIAEALFKLNIPVGNLYAEDNNRQDWETKLKLDCGNELMRRKARSQEIIVHPYMNSSISYTKIRSLDELVKQLYTDFESLTYYGRNEGDELDAADYLHKMLERDFQSKDEDINSIWDFGWNGAVFAFVEKEDVTRDLEKYLLNGLIDEITEELLSMSLFY